MSHDGKRDPMEIWRERLLERVDDLKMFPYLGDDEPPDDQELLLRMAAWELTRQGDEAAPLVRSKQRQQRGNRNRSRITKKRDGRLRQKADTLKEQGLSRKGAYDSLVADGDPDLLLLDQDGEPDTNLDGSLKPMSFRSFERAIRGT